MRARVVLAVALVSVGAGCGSQDVNLIDATDVGGAGGHGGTGGAHDSSVDPVEAGGHGGDGGTGGASDSGSEAACLPSNGSAGASYIPGWYLPAAGSNCYPGTSACVWLGVCHNDSGFCVFYSPDSIRRFAHCEQGLWVVDPQDSDCVVNNCNYPNATEGTCCTSREYCALCGGNSPPFLNNEAIACDGVMWHEEACPPVDGGTD